VLLVLSAVHKRGRKRLNLRRKGKRHDASAVAAHKQEMEEHMRGWSHHECTSGGETAHEGAARSCKIKARRGTSRRLHVVQLPDGYKGDPLEPLQAVDGVVSDGTCEVLSRRMDSVVMAGASDRAGMSTSTGVVIGVLHGVLPARDAEALLHDVQKQHEADVLQDVQIHCDEEVDGCTVHDELVHDKKLTAHDAGDYARSILAWMGSKTRVCEKQHSRCRRFPSGRVSPSLTTRACTL